jgi:polysaccharide export outer membrane protein
MRIFAGTLASALIALASSPSAALAETAAPPAARATVTDPGAQTYILGPADVLEVSVLGHPDFTTKERIDEDGTIRLPYLGSTRAADKTSLQLVDEVANALEKGGYFTKPIVKIDVVSYASRYVTVLGNVGTPGLIPTDRAYRLSEIIARVGGVKEGGADYVVLRPRNGPERRISISSLATGDANDDPIVAAGDKIYSPPAELFYVSGQTKTPGVFPMTKGETIRMAISRGGGLTDAGSDRSVTVTRGGKKMTHVDLDSPVVGGDVIVVGERLF